MKNRFFKSRSASKTSELTRTVFRFGPIGQPPHGYIVLRPDGKIRGYSNPQEDSYRFENETLMFFSADGTKTSDFVESKTTKLLFLPSSVGNHVLEPVFSLGAIDDPKTPNNRPAVFVNTMAKAGTYLVAQSLIETGYAPIKLHLSSHHFHDNRGVSDREIHWDPNARRVSCSASAVAALLRPGEFMVGHVNDLGELNKIKSMGIEIISVVRHPYTQVASMMTFKEKRVKPKPRDKIWQSMSDLNKFKSFLLTHDTSYWLSFGKTITENFPFFRYEDLREGKVRDVGMSDKLLSDLSDGLALAIGKETSTYMSENQQDIRSYFDDPHVKAYFDDVGMSDFAARHWPDAE